MTPRAIRTLLVSASVGLAACQSEFEADLAADPLDNASRVTLALDGVELQLDDGTTRKVKRGDTGFPNLLTFDGDQQYELVVDNSAKKATITGIRLLFADKGSEFVAKDDPEIIKITPPADADFAPIDVKLKKNGNRTTILLGLDLRLSLQAHSGSDYTLSPVLRAVRMDKESDVSGTVGTALRNDSACRTGAAIYAFKGKDVKPDERNSTDPEPFATAPVDLTTGFYHLILMPEGDYTLAFTCDGENENGLGDAIGGDGIGFAKDTHNVTLKNNDSEVQNF